MPVPSDPRVRAACLRAGVCAADDVDRAAALRYELSQRGQEMDLVDALVRQGTINAAAGRAIRAAALADDDASPFAAAAAAAQPSKDADAAGATMDFSAAELASAMSSAELDRWPSAPAATRASEPTVCADAATLAADAAAPVPAPAARERPFGSDLPGRVLSGCRLERELGRGAMGVVFEATHVSLQRRVAVKVLMPSARKQRADVEQFLQEARAMARIEHQNIVQVHDVGEEDGLNYIVMQLLDGSSVAARLEHERVFTWEEACRIARDTARGLAVAHDKNVVHRDIKPENLMLTRDGVVKIADFGLAAQAARGDSDMRTEVMGTPAYMPPEQIDGRSVDGRADVYSLGCTLYVMLTGRRPFEGDNAVEVLLKQTKDVATPVAKLVPGVPPSVSQVVEKCMAKAPSARYQSAADLAADLDKILSGGRPKIVVEIEDVMARMQEIARTEVASQTGPAHRPVVLVAAAIVLICVTAIVMTIALPAVDTVAAESVLEVSRETRNAALAEARRAIEDADAFALRYPDKLDLILRKYDDVAGRYGEQLGAELVAARERARSDFDRRCVAELDRIRKKAEALVKVNDAAGAVHAYHAMRPEYRSGKAGDEWNADVARLLSQVRSSTGMAYVPAGRAGPEGSPSSRDVPAFLIDVTEVTNAEYAVFVKEKGGRAPPYWGGDAPSVTQRELPVVGVTAAEAAAYAAWKGKRLPTAAEWERAARGDDQLLYPWGAEFDASRCVSRAAPKPDLVPVRTFPAGRSWCGALNLAGNAAEWVADTSNDPLVGVGREVRGGSARSHPSACTAAARYWLPEDTQDPALLVGFRCARNP